MEKPLREDQAAHIETPIELGAVDNVTNIIGTSGRSPTGTAPSLLLHTTPMIFATPPPTHPPLFA